MPAPLPRELRERLLAEHDETGHGRVLLGRQFRVGSSTAYRWITERARTGSTTPKVPAKRGPAPKIPDAKLDELRNLVAEKPDRTLQELCDAWLEREQVLVDDATMHRALVRAGVSLKKKRSGSSTETVRTSSRRSRSSSKR